MIVGSATVAIMQTMSIGRSVLPETPTRANDIRATLGIYRYGARDATTRLSDRDFWRSTYTPAGPATVHIWWSSTSTDAEAWGDGADWILGRVPQLIGTDDCGFACPSDAHPKVAAAHRNHPGFRLGASGTLYHELLPIILAQRVTGGEAVRQWHRLTIALGERGPGPDPTLRLPPSPKSLLGRTAWWFHPFGIEAKRAEALRTVARHAERISEWSSLDSGSAAVKLGLLSGIGVWTIGSALGPAFGDPDAVAVGDYHLKNLVAWSLAGEPRGTDARMLELLHPYMGQRGRVVSLLGRDGNAAPAFGPRQRNQPMFRY